jgi:secondary thiamine-phosphate synthase enzyme
MLKIFQDTIQFDCQGRGIYDVTADIQAKLPADAHQGMLNLYMQHTSASLMICENFDSDVKLDVETWLSGIVQDGDKRFHHVMEGIDDMSAHIRTILTQTSISIPVNQGQLALGRWQGICLYEHRLQNHQRQVMLTLIYE